MPKIDFPDSSQSPFEAPNGVKYVVCAWAVDPWICVQAR